MDDPDAVILVAKSAPMSRPVSLAMTTPDAVCQIIVSATQPAEVWRQFVETV